MNPPTRAMLAVFRASVRLMNDETLAKLRDRFIELKEHPAGIQVIDRELARRKRDRLMAPNAVSRMGSNTDIEEA